jgi:hypothetical protein
LDCNRFWFCTSLTFYLVIKGEEREISKVRIRFERAFAQIYRIDVSLNTPDFESKWVTVARSNDGKQGWNELALSNVSARYLKLAEEKASVEGWGMSIWELEVWSLPVKKE